ncbi:putative Two-component system protein B [Glarea lozoyensis 74030]|uniref:histidine kinase n=1 Tax=Glarea lozoyensis (strain ATCC 74030 / MF5533) TaxID=1104152 RepID=H0ET52_GLAL7|nr:putative Two-component system protein B [Glarea lozoyensis 74030]
MTLPIVDDKNPEVVLGFMTVVAACTSLIDVVNSREGRRENQFPYQARPATATKEPDLKDVGAAVVKYVFPPNATEGRDRHTAYLANITRYGASNFSAKEYPAAVRGFGVWNNEVNQAGSMLSTRNENNVSVSVGYARPQSKLVDWLLIVEMTHKEAWKPVEKLRLIVLALTGKRKTPSQRNEEDRRRVFKIPARVQDRKHWITDELTELTGTFNEMTEELMLQYQGLEEKVAERTRELEISKKAAEAANESKTLFIANISHELKTPLNGILGMCAVCMGEDDLPQIKKSLQIVYKSGDLLLHLLNDLLTFSKNQIGQQLSLEEKEFKLNDIKTQIVTIFTKQVKEKNINFSVKYIGTDIDLDTEIVSEKKLPALGPQGTGRLKDMCLWGDQHRILQVIINLVSNSLKFTPAGGKVSVRIKCLGEAESPSDRNSLGSKKSKNSSRHRHGSDPSAAPRVQVEDSGPGIPESMQDKVFEPFVQGDLGLSKKYGGTGLGLSICSQLSQLMGGTVSLVQIPLKHTKSRAASTSSSDAYGASRPTSGVFTTQTDGTIVTGSANASGRNSGDFNKETRLVGLSQPFFAAASPTSPDDKSKELGVVQSVLKKAVTANGKEPAKKLRVLVAEDNLVNQEIVIRMLKLERIYDVEVVVAEDGKEAYDIVKESMDKGQYFNLIFMDIQVRATTTDSVFDTNFCRCLTSMVFKARV